MAPLFFFLHVCVDHIMLCKLCELILESTEMCWHPPTVSNKRNKLDYSFTMLKWGMSLLFCIFLYCSWGLLCMMWLICIWIRGEPDWGFWSPARTGFQRVGPAQTPVRSGPVQSGPPGPDFWQKWSKMEEAESNFEKNVHFLFNK